MSAYLVPTSASFQASLQAEASAQVSSGSPEKIQDVQYVANLSRNLPDTTVLQFGDPASFAEDGGVSAYLVPTSASFQASLQAEASAQVSSGSAEKIQDVQYVANPSRYLPDTTVLQFGDPASFAEDGGVSAYLVPTSASFQASLQAEASAQVSSGYAEKIQDVQYVANPSRNLPDTTVLQFGDPASFAEDGGVSAYLVSTSASFQASLQAEASAQVSSGSAERIQDVQYVANPSRNLPDTTVLQFGDPASFAEDGGVSAYLVPTSASFQASLQAEASAQVSSGSAEKIQDVQYVANPSRNLPDTTVLQFGDPASFAEDGGVSAYLLPTSASFQASLQAEASAQVSSGSAERIQDV